MIEPEHILEVLKATKEAVKKEDVVKLKELSNQTIHSASINQDTESITLAVIIYSLGKILERTNYRDFPSWNNFLKEFMNNIERAINALKEKDEENFRLELKKVRREISKLPVNFKNNIQSVFRKAEINKASKIYEHGISMEQTAKLLGISLWDLAEYAGQSGASDINLTVTLDIKKRLQNAEEIFR